MNATNQPVSLRVSPRERALLELAAQHNRTSLSDFIRRKALEAAEIDVIDHRLLTIPAADWEKFEAWAEAPAREVPALAKLAARPLAWQE